MLAFYHTGAAALAADHEGEDFCCFLLDNYNSLPRGSARRHFRGEQGGKALLAMQKLSPMSEQYFMKFAPTYAGVKSTCEKSLIQFGPYFQLKVCDYMDRCLNLPIRSYTGLERNLPADPAKAVGMMFPDSSVPQAFMNLCREAATWGILAAPWFERPIGPAEVETSLCGWKTTVLRGNWFGADIIDKRQALVGFGEKARQLMDMMPPVISKDLFVIQLD